MLRLFRIKPGELGFTMAELIVAAALLSVLAAGGAVTYNRFTRSSQQADLRDAMASLRKEIQVALTNPKILANSLTHPENKDFFTCFGSSAVSSESSRLAITRRNAIVADPQLTADCQATDKVKFYPLVLISLRGGVVSGGTSSSDGTRSTSVKRLITARGYACSDLELKSDNERCEIEVTTAFRAVCAAESPGSNPAAECMTPEKVELFFTVRQVKTGVFYKRGIIFPSLSNMINSDGSARQRVDALTLSAREFVRPDFYECPQGQTFRGFDKSGKILCSYQENPCARLGIKFKNWIFHGMNPDGTLNCKMPLQGEDCTQSGKPLSVLRGVLPDGTLDCVDPQISKQGCKTGQVLVRFDRQGDPVCVNSIVDTDCPRDHFLVGYDNVGNPRCVKMKTPSGQIRTEWGPKCGHNWSHCAYTSKDKPKEFQPSCPEGWIQVGAGYVGPKCCATCGWIGQWWCDQLYVECSPTTTAEWQ